MKKLIIMSTSILLLSACGNNAETENEETTEETSEETSEVVDSNEDQSDDEIEEPQDDESDPENNDNDESESEENDRDDSKLTEEEAEERVVNYREEQEDRDSEYYQFGMEEEGDVFIASMHTAPSADERIGSPIIARYEVDRTTGEVREIDMGPEEPEPHLSEITSMSEEERREHHRELFADEGSLEEDVLDNLMLPGLHENTETYEGRVNPGDSFELSLLTTDTSSGYDDLDFALDIDDEGYFTIDLSPYDLSNKSVLRFEINGNYAQEQIFDLPISEAEEGMESIGIRE